MDDKTNGNTEDKTANPAAEQDDAVRLGYRIVRYAAHDKEQALFNDRADNLWGHARPNSILVTSLGHHWKPGCWQHVQDMVQFTNTHGYYCSFEEIMDRCFNPYDSLGAMRNECIMRGSQGYEYLLMIDNDIYPAAEDLVRLVDRGVSITAPMVNEPSTGRALHGPPHKPYTGLQPSRWTVLSMLLFRTSVFNATGPELFNDSIGADEGYHFQKLWHYGHRPYVDTDIQLRVADNPTYPLATNRMEKDESDDFWEKRRKRLLEVPDRRPLNSANPRVNDLGEYLPFIEPAKSNGNGAAPVSADRLAALSKIWGTSK